MNTLMHKGFPVWIALAMLALRMPGAEAMAGVIRVATYNVETYLDQSTETRPRVKSAEAKEKVCESIRILNPDVIALEEMGGTNALLELRGSLGAGGQHFDYWEEVQGFDPDIHVAVLSKLPIVASRPHTNDDFLLDGRRMRVKRGFAEVDIAGGGNFVFTVIVAHLKSRLATPEADQAEERLGEAKVLRGIIDGRLTRDPEAKMIVLGDFNDTRDSAPVREILGRGKRKLFDTRPAERNGDTAVSEPPYFEPRDVAWTYFYGKEDTYSRIDYIAISPGLLKNWVKEDTYIPTIPNWGAGSDHRPIVAGFETRER
jgi:endonuclease/exonuclease/phosphatase family metal-dependent hydrolase